MKARVVLIFKEGVSNKCENYKPISLPSALCKIYAAVLQRKNPTNTRWTFTENTVWIRKDSSIAGAVHLIRQTNQFREGTDNQLQSVLLEWGEHSTK